MPVIYQAKSFGEVMRAWGTLKNQDIPATVMRAGGKYYISSTKPLAAQRILLRAGIVELNTMDSCHGIKCNSEKEVFNLDD